MVAEKDAISQEQHATIDVKHAVILKQLALKHLAMLKLEFTANAAIVMLIQYANL